MFTLKSLRVCGFRGFLDTDAGHFDLGGPITVLFGPNGRGKSSTLNAIEWALFGSECSGTKTDIRERVNWIITNQRANPGKVTVELEMQDGDGIYMVRRELQSRARRKAADGDVEIELPDSECLTGAQAAQFLDRLLRSTFRDFATTVYQHQEAIRVIVTQQPRDRSDAIDRLLGLSDHRNLLNALNKVDAKGKQKDFVGEWEAFENQVKTALQTRENVLEERRNKAKNDGVPRNKLNAAAALTFAGEIVQALGAFAAEAGLEPPPLVVPEEWAGLSTFHDKVKAAIDRLRGAVPGVEKQEKLIGRRTKVIEVKEELEEANKDRDGIGKQIRELDKEHRSQKEVNKRIIEVRNVLEEEKARLRESNSRAALIREAITFLETEVEKEQPSSLCPVCGNEAPGLLEMLRSLWEEKLQAQSGKIETKIKSLEEQQKKLQDAADGYEKQNGELEKVLKKLGNSHREAGVLLEQEIAAEDEPLPLLKAEAVRIERRLQELSGAVQEKQTRLSTIEKELDKVRTIHEILHLEEMKEILEQIQQSPEYTELEDCRDDAAKLVDDLEAIRAAISEATNEEAHNKLAAAETAIDRYFRLLTNHPAVSAIKLEVDTSTRTQHNDYTITDQDGTDLTPVLSQGDLNALALAIFLGLAASAKESGTFGFVLMDDPSQSLDSEHKNRLVQVLNEVVASQKQLVISTMDQEFRDCLAAHLTKTKTEYVFESWTPQEGPTITRK
jgi:DNA repair exonuclease SbcCD ATPase subunit